MANLTAVLRKTIDGLPNATPQLRAKVYEKARGAITRQIEAANPPLEEHVVEARYRVLEDAIRETEAHYAPAAEPEAPAFEPAAEPLTAAPAATAAAPAASRDAAPPAARAPAAPAPYVPEAPAEPEAVPAPEPAFAPPAPRADRPSQPFPAEPAPAMGERPAPASFPRATPTTRPFAPPAFPRVSGTDGPAEPPSAPPRAPAPPPTLDRPAVPERSAPPAPEPSFAPERRPAPEPSFASEPAAEKPVEPRVGVVGPAEQDPETLPAQGTSPGSATAAPRADARSPRTLRPATVPPRAGEREAAGAAAFAGIPEADLAAPRYPARRARSGGTPKLAIGAVAASLLGLGAVGLFYLDDIRSLVGGGSTPVATQTPGTTDQAEPPATTGGEPPATAAAPEGEATDVAPPAAGTGANGVRAREFTQRLLPDGTEVDEGPGTGGANAFEEGTDVAAATPNPAEGGTAEGGAQAPAAAPAATAPPTDAPATQAPIAVGQRAVFYEERSADREGTQQDGSVVWSLVNEPPADGQPAEPAVRAVAEISGGGLKMTMTIRRNADETLPASHVIEILFDTPNGAPGGGIENVQRLALKPTEEARGEPLIGISGKISDGFFIIALNDLQQAVQTNLGLLGREEWIDIPLAYANGQRALVSIEKGIPGGRVFQEAIEAWNART